MQLLKPVDLCTNRPDFPAFKLYLNKTKTKKQTKKPQKNQTTKNKDELLAEIKPDIAEERNRWIFKENSQCIKTLPRIIFCIYTVLLYIKRSDSINKDFAYYISRNLSCVLFPHFNISEIRGR